MKGYWVIAATLSLILVLTGCGLGTGTVAEGWLNQAVRFWKQQM